MAQTVPATLMFACVHASYRPRLLAYLCRLLGPADAEDVVQEVFLRIERALPHLHYATSLRPWLYRVAERAARDWLRRRRVTRRSDSTDAGDLAGLSEAAGEGRPSAEYAWLTQATRSCVRMHAELLPEPYRVPLLLSESDGLTDAQIGSALQLSVGAVKIRLHRARQRLRRELSRSCAVYAGDDNRLVCEPHQRSRAA